MGGLTASPTDTDMRRPVQDPATQSANGRVVVLDGARRGRKGGERGRRNEATLEIGAGAVSDAAIRGLLDDWLIPMIVEDLIRVATGRRCQDDPIDMTG